MKQICTCLLTALIAISCSKEHSESNKEHIDFNERQVPSDTFFDQNKLTEIGVYYYPDQSSEDQWERDIKNIAELGLEFVHMGEFSWTKMQPSEDVFDFEWLDKNVALCEKYGLKVIMSTPSAIPPVWLVEKHPEILMQHANGTIAEQGSRQFASWSSEIYRQYVTKIVTELAKKYGQNDVVWGWQLDNEPSHYAWVYDYSKAALTRFRIFLKNKYGTINRLNECWGNSFWSQTYDNFEQIKLPNQHRQVQEINQHARLDFEIFSSQEMGSFLGMQTKTLRKYIKSDQFVTTNYYLGIPDYDPFVTKEKLTFTSMTFYPLNSYNETASGDVGFRLGSGTTLSMAHDFFRSINGYTGIMELQPGQINWGVYNPLPQPGAVRMWAWHVFSLGSKFICTYRYNQPRFGNEMYHHGIVRTDGITPSMGGEEFIQVAKELKKVRSSADPEAKTPKQLSDLKTAVVWDFISTNDIKNIPHTKAWNNNEPMGRFYTLLKKIGAPVTFVRPEDPIAPAQYPYMVLPAVQLVKPSQVQAWEKYVTEGGNLIITSRTGQKDSTGHLWEAELQAPISQLIGGTIHNYDQLPWKRKAKINYKDQIFEWQSWADLITAHDSSFIIAKHQDQFYKGQTACLQRPLGKGTVTYIGAYSIDGNLEFEILKDLFKRKHKISELPPHIFREWRDGLWIVTNYSSTNFTQTLPDSAQIIIGQRIVEPGEVLIWND